VAKEMNQDLIMLGHGSGGMLSAKLLNEVLFKIFTDVQPTDGAVLQIPAGRLPVLTTDSYVVKPLFFPGGNIGKIAVNGTVNDLAMMGAEPGYLSIGFIIEEGFKINDFITICNAMAEAARQAGIKIVTGDTKVVGRGETDGIYINTSGVGFVDSGYHFSTANIQAGDKLIVSGGIGDHGTAVFAQRLGVAFKPELTTDSAPLWPSVAALLEAGIVPRIMRDITRGGLATIICELVAGKAFNCRMEERSVPIDVRVKRACDIWGFDPAHVASEGRYVAVVDGNQASQALEIMKTVAVSADAKIIGEFLPGKGKVTMLTDTGGVRPVYPLPDELLPRIC
jgi:hydrogenase expression/formation protein HypE